MNNKLDGFSDPLPSVKSTLSLLLRVLILMSLLSLLSIELGLAQVYAQVEAQANVQEHVQVDAAENSLKGSWVEVAAANAEGIPMHVFSLDIDRADENISGNYCYVSNYGNRIECKHAFKGKRLAADRYQISFGGALTGAVAELRWLNAVDAQVPQNKSAVQLLWTLIQYPRKADISMPTLARLSPQQANAREQDRESYLMIQAQRAYLYKAADPATQTQSYLIKGDKVLEMNRRKGWVEVEYKGQTVGWIQTADLQ
ncbi:hypothetical protein EC844_103202 [Acinetobacter calcoaceticus]|uniref:SH3 domain-containing protein n=1 Tax=Acinetobacter calcoaceticus TaxID=471 RepID=A0A4R1Y301_ACICA|nr:hypothetical protein EC844_103202 [Acinetobacter calcoaceticus]